MLLTSIGIGSSCVCVGSKQRRVRRRGWRSQISLDNLTLVSSLQLLLRAAARRASPTYTGGMGEQEARHLRRVVAGGRCGASKKQLSERRVDIKEVDACGDKGTLTRSKKYSPVGD